MQNRTEHVQAEKVVAELRARLSQPEAQLSPAEQALAAELIAVLEERLRPGLLTAALGMVAESPLRAVLDLLPASLVEPAERSIVGALLSLSELAARTADLGEVRQQVLRALGHSAEPADPIDVARLEAVVSEVVTADPKVGALAGGAGGLLGLPALPVEIPIVVGLALRAAHRVAAGFGLPATEPTGMALPLHALDLALGGDLPGAVVRAVAFATGGALGGEPAGGAQPEAPGRDEIVVEVLPGPPSGTPLQATPIGPSAGALVTAPLTGAAGKGLIEGLRVLARGADPLAYVQIRVTVQRLAVRLAARKLAGAVPLLGAAVGGALGYGLVERVRQSARTLAALRLLSVR